MELGFGFGKFFVWQRVRSGASGESAFPNVPLAREFGNERFKIWDLGFWNWDLVLESSSFGREFEAELQEKVRSHTFRLRGEFGNEGEK